jgi:hypothetical protein
MQGGLQPAINIRPDESGPTKKCAIIPACGGDVGPDSPRPVPILACQAAQHAGETQSPVQEVRRCSIAQAIEQRRKTKTTLFVFRL